MEVGRYYRSVKVTSRSRGGCTFTYTDNTMAKRESEDDTACTNYPQKRFYRQRAHCNPLSFNDGFKYPLNPADANWKLHYPYISDDNRIVRFVDVGMGFGGLTVALGT